MATAAAQAVEHVGLPEARYALAQAAIYLSLAPKSDAAGGALLAAQRHVREHGAGAGAGMAALGAAAGAGRGGYDNPHGHPGHVSPQQLLPEGVVGERFYEPDEAEAQLAERLERIRRAAPPSSDNRLCHERGSERDLQSDRRASCPLSSARDPATGAIARQRRDHTAGALSSGSSRRSPRCSRCGRCCG